MGIQRLQAGLMPTLGAALALAALLLTCRPTPPQGEVPAAPLSLVTIEDDVVERINADLVPGPLTMDVGILIPSNLDPGFDRVNVRQMLDGVRSAKAIFGAVDVQLRLLWVKTGPIPEEYLAITSAPLPTEPGSRHAGSMSRYLPRVLGFK